MSRLLSAVERAADTREVQALLDVIAIGEVPQSLDRDQQYRVQVGGAILSDLSEHPREVVWIPGYNLGSSAAGRYQFLGRTWDECVNALGLRDFSPRSQDLAAAYLVRRRGALGDLYDGDLGAVWDTLSWEWASLPGPDGDSRYGQAAPHTQAWLTAEYYRRLGALPSPAQVLAVVPKPVALLGAALGVGAVLSNWRRVRARLSL